MTETGHDARVWDRLWRPERRLAVNRTAREIMRAMLDAGLRLRGASVLELGCGAGRVSALAAAAGAARIVLVDVSEDALRLARETVGPDVPAEFVKADALTLDLGERFDVVMSAGVVEHFRGPELEEIAAAHARHSRRDVAIVVPASPHANDLRMRLRRTRNAFGYQRPFTPGRLRQLIKNAGLRPAGARRFYPSYGLFDLLGPRGTAAIEAFLGFAAGVVGGLVLGTGKVRNDR